MDEVIGEPFDLIFTEEDLKKGIPKREIQKALKATGTDGICIKGTETQEKEGKLIPFSGSSPLRVGSTKS